MSADTVTGATAPLLLLNAEPRVQLLPPMVTERERSRSAGRLAVMIVLLAVLIAIGLYLFASWRATTAASELQRANDETASLLTQQGEYRVATDTQTMIDYIEEAQTSLTSYEVDWAALLGEIDQVLPKGSTIESFTVDGQSAWEVPLAGEDALSVPRIASITMTVTAPQLEDLGVYRDGLITIPGVGDAQVTGYDYQESTVTITMALTTDAVSGRYDDAAGDTADSETGDTTADGAATDGEG